MSFERHFKIAAQMQNIASACDFVINAARAAGLSEQGVYHCHLAVDEACTNIIEHGFLVSSPENIIHIICAFHEDTLTIVIEDNGKPFDPTQVQDPDITLDIQERQLGGYGVFFIKRFMDEVSYEHADEVNRLVLLKHVPIEKFDTILAAQMDILQVPPSISVIIPVGALDANTSHALRSAIENELNNGHKDLIIDLRDVQFLSSASLKVLVRAWQQAREELGEVLLCCLSQPIRALMSSIGLDLVFTIMPTRQSAIERLKNKK